MIRVAERQEADKAERQKRKQGFLCGGRGCVFKKSAPSQHIRRNRNFSVLVLNLNPKMSLIPLLHVKRERPRDIK